mmetsp:Transcript_70462/g.166102  ORF Transcript_70462/g.166102 Transcript_70462/m.166102 type:complete len:643 (+) Transcript_70462:166-2094(+)
MCWPRAAGAAGWRGSARLEPLQQQVAGAQGLRKIQPRHRGAQRREFIAQCCGKAGGQLLAQRHRAHVSRHQQQPQLLQHLQRIARRQRWVGRPADGRAGRQLPQRGIEQGLQVAQCRSGGSDIAIEPERLLLPPRQRREGIRADRAGQAAQGVQHAHRIGARALVEVAPQRLHLGRRVPAEGHDNALVERLPSTQPTQRRAAVEWRRLSGRCRGRCTLPGLEVDDVAPQAVHHLLQVHRLGDMVTHAGGEAGLAVGGHRIGRHRDDQRIGPARQDALGGLEAVDVGHLQIHQDGIEGGLGDQGQVHALDAATGQRDDGTFAFQQLAGDLAVEAVVLHHQQPHAFQSGICALGRPHAQRFTAGGFGHRILQHRGRDRLDQVAAEAGDLLLAAFGQQLTPMGRDHDDHGRVGLAAFADAARGFPAVQPRHAPVHQDDVVVRRAALGCPVHHAQGLLAAGRQIAVPAQALADALEHLAGRGVVVDDQHLQAGPRRNRVAGLGRSDRQRQLEVEAAALADAAGHAQLTAHQRHQLAADRQTQAGAAIAPRGRLLGLAEAGKDVLELVVGDADAGVADLEADACQGAVLAQQCQGQHDLAVLGELQRIAGQVQQHLAQSRGISDQRRRQPGVQREQHLDVLVAHMGG